MNQGAIIVIVVGVILVLGVLAALFARRSKQKRSEHLRTRFGPEYDRVVGEAGSADRAEKRLEERERRSRKIIIRPLGAQDREYFESAWGTVQGRFVDAPGEAVIEADQLLQKLMAQRGYPVGDFEQQAEDVSVDHPVVVQNYRQAHGIAERQRQGSASTEELREAVIQYRSLYEELLSPGISTPTEVTK